MLGVSVGRASGDPQKLIRDFQCWVSLDGGQSLICLSAGRRQNENKLVVVNTKGRPAEIKEKFINGQVRPIRR